MRDPFPSVVGLAIGAIGGALLVIAFDVPDGLEKVGLVVASAVIGLGIGALHGAREET